MAIKAVDGEPVTVDEEMHVSPEKAREVAKMLGIDDPGMVRTITVEPTLVTVTRYVRAD